MAFTYHFPRPSLTTDAIVIATVNNQKFILLIKRKFDPFKGYWALPGGFINMDEDLETACARELFEETGISVPTLIQFRTFGNIDRDPRGRTISVVFSSNISEKMEAKCGDDASKAQWFTLNDLPPLAFDHRQIVNLFCEETKIC